MKKYAVREEDGEVITMVDAANLGEAVGMKFQSPQAYCETLVVDDDDVFTVCEATPKEISQLQACWLHRRKAANPITVWVPDQSIWKL